MPILIPRRLKAPPRRRPSSPMFGVYYTLGQITGKPATIPDLTQALAKLRRSDVIRWLAALSARIGADQGMDLDYHLQLSGSSKCFAHSCDFSQ
jgi:hypothetical protein